MSALERILAGDRSDETLDELRHAVTAWMLDTERGPDLSRVLGLGTRRSARLARRDALLRDAAALLTGRPGERARALVEVARLVRVRRAPKWDRRGVPDTADPVEALVYRAAQLERIPDLKMLRGIIDAVCRAPAASAQSAGI